MRKTPLECVPAGFFCDLHCVTWNIQVDPAPVNRHPENPEYRASVLIRAFRVEEVKTIPGLLFTQQVDKRSTYFYNALFMGGNVIDGGMSVYWHDNDVKQCEAPLSKPRENVGEFVEKTHKKGFKYYEKKKEFEQDIRAWAFYRK